MEATLRRGEIGGRDQGCRFREVVAGKVAYGLDVDGGVQDPLLLAERYPA
jgi:hypothetical protein